MSDPQNAETIDMAFIISKIDSRLSVIENVVDRLDKAFFGNGKPGIQENYHNLENKFADNYHILENKITDNCYTLGTKIEDHLKDEKKEKERKNQVSNKVWAVLLCVIGAIVTQTVALAFLFIRFGTIK